MKKIIILIGHGALPFDFPEENLKEYLLLRVLKKGGKLKEKKRFEILEEKLKKWKRTPRNDIHYFSLKKIADALQKETGIKCDFCFNEFCSPGIEEIFEKYKDMAEEIYFIPAVLTQSRETENTVRKIEGLKSRYKSPKIEYIYPLEEKTVADFLKTQIGKKIKKIS